VLYFFVTTGLSTFFNVWTHSGRGSVINNSEFWVLSSEFILTIYSIKMRLFNEWSVNTSVPDWQTNHYVSLGPNWLKGSKMYNMIHNQGTLFIIKLLVAASLSCKILKRVKYTYTCHVQIAKSFFKKTRFVIFVKEFTAPRHVYTFCGISGQVLLKLNFFI